MRRWKLGLCIAIALGSALWGFGVSNNHRQPTGLGAASAKLPSFAVLAQKASAEGSIRPVGSPEFSATFTGRKLDTSVWSTCYPWMDVPGGCTDFGNSDEFQWYLPSQDVVSNNVLALIAQRGLTAGKDEQGQPHEYNCRSGVATTYPGFRFEYGYVQVVAWIPTGPGLWPALWLAAANLQWPPEIDLIESWGTTKSGAFFHPVAAQQATGRTNKPITQGWHTFDLSWTKSQLTWYLDGKVLLTVRQNVPHQQMYFIANLAEYVRPLAKAECTGQLLIRSVKVWQN
jgi:beta-glucanase (GH16 family)